LGNDLKLGISLNIFVLFVFFVDQLIFLGLLYEFKLVKECLIIKSHNESRHPDKKIVWLLYNYSTLPYKNN